MNRSRKKSVITIPSSCLIIALDCELGFHAVAESILKFFNSLPDSLIPSILFERCLLASKTPEATLQVHFFIAISMFHVLGFK